MDTIPILVVDANPTFVRMITQGLRAYWYPEVMVVGTSLGGDDALVQARSLQPRITLLGLSQHLVGLELIPHLHTTVPGMGIIALGPLDLSAHQQMALKAGADAFVAKTALDIALLPTIWNVAGYTTSSKRMSGLRNTVRMVSFMPQVESAQSDRFAQS